MSLPGCMHQAHIYTCNIVHRRQVFASPSLCLSGMVSSNCSQSDLVTHDGGCSEHSHAAMMMIEEDRSEAQGQSRSELESDDGHTRDYAL